MKMILKFFQKLLHGPQEYPQSLGNFSKISEAVSAQNFPEFPTEFSTGILLEIIPGNIKLIIQKFPR